MQKKSTKPKTKSKKSNVVAPKSAKVDNEIANASRRKLSNAVKPKTQNVKINRDLTEVKKTSADSSIGSKVDMTYLVKSMAFAVLLIVAIVGIQVFSPTA